VSTIRPGFTVLLAALIFLPVFAWPRDNMAAFKKILEDRGLPFEEGFLFSDSPPEDGGPSLVLRFPGDGAEAGAGDAGEWYRARPLMAAVFPAETAETGPAPEGLPYPFRAALALAEGLRARQAEGRRLPGDLLAVLLGPGDAGRYESRAAGELASYGGVIGEPENTFFWYMDLAEAPRSLVIHHGTARTLAALDSLRGLPELFRSLDIPYRFAVPFNEMYKLGLAGGPEILRFTQEQGIRALAFSGRPGPGEAVSEDDLAELILAYAGSLENSGENPDYHYLIVPPLGFLSQEQTALLLMLFAAFFFLALLIYLGVRRPPPARILTFFRCFWIIPGFFILFFVSLEAAGLLASLLAKGEARVPMIYGWAAWKLILSLAFFALISIPLGNYRISRRAVFYGRGAVLLIILDVFVAAWADICFIPFFTLAFALILLGTQARRPVPVYLCAALAPLYGFIAGVFSIRSGYGGLGEMILSSGPLPTAVMILAFLPFVLLFKRGMILARRKKSSLRRRLLPFYVLSGLDLALGLILFAAR
jgi:hypothetical protein